MDTEVAVTGGDSMKKMSRKKTAGMMLYIFIAIFQPPILPCDLIYISLIVTLFLIVVDSDFKLDLRILRESRLLVMIKVIVTMLVYVITIDLIDMLFIDHTDMLSNRLRIINQLVILTGEELLAVYYLLTRIEKYSIDRYSFFSLIIGAGTVQGGLSVLAYLVPSIRTFFLRYSGSLFENAWILERRGYGYSAILVDTFGYGMALIAGTSLLISKNNHFRSICSIMLMGFCILVNARTGIVVFLLAIMLYILKTNSVVKAIIKIVFAGASVVLIYHFILPTVLLWGIRSSNSTIKWITSDFYDMYYRTESSARIADSYFISNVVKLPENIFELCFGSGHSVYGTKLILGFATDIGYINLVWAYGILGTSFFLISMYSIMYNTYKSCKTNDMKLIALFNLIAYFLVLVKGILLGYNPGTMIMYLMIFSINYYNRKEHLYV